MDKVKDYAKANDVPIIQDGGLAFLLETIKKRGCNSILELGTAIGYSSSHMALLDPEIKIDTVEKNVDMYQQAVKNIKEAKLEDQITCHLMAIEDFNTNQYYDFIFIDAAKAQYMRYLNQFLPNLKQGGCVFFDNMEFHGMVNDPSLAKSKRTLQLVKKIKAIREALLNDQRFNSQYYPHIGDGILILERKDV